MIKYSLDFILHAAETDNATLKNSLTEFCEELDISEKAPDSGPGTYFGIKLLAEDPTLIFDICSQFGRIKSVKVREV